MNSLSSKTIDHADHTESKKRKSSPILSPVNFPPHKSLSTSVATILKTTPQEPTTSPCPQNCSPLLLQLEPNSKSNVFSVVSESFTQRSKHYNVPIVPFPILALHIEQENYDNNNKNGSTLKHLKEFNSLAIDEDILPPLFASTEFSQLAIHPECHNDYDRTTAVDRIGSFYSPLCSTISIKNGLNCYANDFSYSDLERVISIKDTLQIDITLNEQLRLYRLLHRSIPLTALLSAENFLTTASPRQSPKQSLRSSPKQSPRQLEIRNLVSPRRPQRQLSVISNVVSRPSTHFPMPKYLISSEWAKNMEAEFKALPNCDLWTSLQRQISDAYITGLKESLLRYALISPSIVRRYGLSSSCLTPIRHERRRKEYIVRQPLPQAFMAQLETIYSSYLLEALSGWNRLIDAPMVESTLTERPRNLEEGLGKVKQPAQSLKGQPRKIIRRSTTKGSSQPKLLKFEEYFAPYFSKIELIRKNFEAFNQRTLIQLRQPLNKSEETEIHRASRNGLLRFLASKAIGIVESLLDELTELVSDWSKEGVQVSPLIIEKIISTLDNNLTPVHDPKALEALVLSAMSQVLSLIAPTMMFVDNHSTHHQSQQPNNLPFLFEARRNILIELCQRRSTAINEIIKPLQLFKPFSNFVALSQKRQKNFSLPLDQPFLSDDPIPSSESLVCFPGIEASSDIRSWGVSPLSDIPSNEIEDFVTNEFVLPLNKLTEWPDRLVMGAMVLDFSSVLPELKSSVQQSCHIVMTQLEHRLLLINKEALYCLKTLEDIQRTRPVDEKQLRRLQRSFDHFVRETSIALELKYSKMIVPLLLNLLSLGLKLDESALNFIVKLTLSVQSLNKTIEKTRSMLNAYHSEFLIDLEKLESELSTRMEASQAMIEALKDWDTVNHVRQQSEVVERLSSSLIASRDETISLLKRRADLKLSSCSNTTGWDELVVLLEPFKQLTEIVYSLDSLESDVESTVITKLNLEHIDHELTRLWKSASRLNLVFAEYQNSPLASLTTVVSHSVDTLRNYLPLIRIFATPGLQRRHWSKIYEVIEYPSSSDLNMTLSQLVKTTQVVKHLPELLEIRDIASREAFIETSLKALSDDWDLFPFKICKVLDKNIERKKDLLVLQLNRIEEIQSQLDDQVTRLNALKVMRGANEYADRLASWDVLLTKGQNLIDLLTLIQSKVSYLEPIFDSNDIKIQIPSEWALFNKVRETWIRTLLRLQTIPILREVLQLEDFKQTLQQLQEAVPLLAAIERGLTSDLDTKRLAFPRFYFISDDELLSILSESRNPVRVQPYLRKCFDGINRLQFSPNSSDEITALISPEGEILELTKPLELTDNDKSPIAVEAWLNEMERLMIVAVKHSIIQVVQSLYLTPMELIQSFPSQAVICANQILWTTDVERCLKGDDKNEKPSIKKGLKVSSICCGLTPRHDFGTGTTLSTSPVHTTTIHKNDGIKFPDKERRDVLNAKLDEEDKLSQLSDKLTKDINTIVGYLKIPNLSTLHRQTCEALIVLNVHQRNVVNELIHLPRDLRHVYWSRELKYYIEPKRHLFLEDLDLHPKVDIWCRMASWTFPYCYEYLGTTSRLVRTPLTRRCYETMCLAVSESLGGAPEGPAGTGKTETVRDLAKSLGRRCIVINCSDALDSSTMAKFFKGIAASGQWCCFDEFNRIDPEVLSVVADQLLRLQTAISNNQKSILFEGTKLPLNPNCNCFITMNPGYAGRAELPHNLKSLFRPIVMQAADVQDIAETMLLAEGFNHGSQLSGKLVSFFKLFETLVSQQVRYAKVRQLEKKSHYDSGMRALRSALSAAGILRAKYPELSEESIILRALYDVSAAKLLEKDKIPFGMITRDLFNGVPLINMEDEIIISMAKEILDSSFLDSSDSIIEKILQLYRTLNTRHGVMIVGESGSGKSTALLVLSKVLNRLAQRDLEYPVKSTTIAPKAYQLNELFGYYDPKTKEWNEGLLGIEYKRLLSETNDTKGDSVRRWIIFDGPIDSLWVENLNSLLDDNKRLCLANGESLGLPPLMNIIFETPNLKQASPATVSRCGMIYFEPKRMNAPPIPMMPQCLHSPNASQKQQIDSLDRESSPALQPEQFYSTPIWKSTLEFHLASLCPKDLTSLPGLSSTVIKSLTFTQVELIKYVSNFVLSVIFSHIHCQDCLTENSSMAERSASLFRLNPIHHVESYCCMLRSILSSMERQRQQHRQHEYSIQTSLNSKQHERYKREATSSSQRCNEHYSSSSCASFCAISSQADDAQSQQGHLNGMILESDKVWISQLDSNSADQGIPISNECIVSACIFGIILGIGCSLPLSDREYFNEKLKQCLFKCHLSQKSFSFGSTDEHIEDQQQTDIRLLHILPGIKWFSNANDRDAKIHDIERITTSVNNCSTYTLMMSESNDITASNQQNQIQDSSGKDNDDLLSYDCFEWVFDWWKDEWTTWNNWAKRVRENVVQLIDFPFVGKKTQRMTRASLPYGLDSPVLTSEFIRNSFIINLMIIYRRPLLIVGPTATGKTLTLEHVISHLDSTKYPLISLPSRSTTLKEHLSTIQSSSHIVRRRRSVLGPPASASTLLLTLQGIDRSQPDEWNVRAPQEFVRYLIEHSGWFNPKESQFNMLIDTTFIATLTLRPMSLSSELQNCHTEIRNNYRFNENSDLYTSKYIDLRLLKHFQVLYLPELNQLSAHAILITQFEKLKASTITPSVNLSQHSFSIVPEEGNVESEKENSPRASEQNDDPNQESHEIIKHQVDEIGVVAIGIAQLLFAMHKQICETFQPSTLPVESLSGLLWEPLTKRHTRIHVHYNFRHLTKILQNLTLLDHVKNSVAEFIFHELMRVYGGPLCHETEVFRLLKVIGRTTVEQMHNESSNEFLMAFFNVVWGDIKPEKHHLQLDTVNKHLIERHLTSTGQLRRVYFGAGPSSKYLLTENQRCIITSFEEDLGRLNTLSAGPPLRMVLFHSLLDRLLSLRRSLQLGQDSHVLLIGIPGSGRRSVARLIGSSLRFAVVDISLASVDSEDAITGPRDVLKSAIRQAILCGKPTSSVDSNRGVMLLCDENQLTTAGLLDDLLTVICGDDLTSLFPSEERLELFEQFRIAFRYPSSTPIEQLRSLIRVKLRRHLHVVLSISGWDANMHTPCRMTLQQFELLLNRCSVHWFSNWSSDGFHTVARRALQSCGVVRETVLSRVGSVEGDSVPITNTIHNVDSQPEEENGMLKKINNNIVTEPNACDLIIDKCAEMCIFIHKDVEKVIEKESERGKRFLSITPAVFMNFITTTVNIVSTRQSELRELYSRYKGGLEKMAETEASIALIQEELKRLQPILAQKVSESAALMATVEAETARVSTFRLALKDEEEEAKAAADQAHEIKMECERDLSEVMPQLKSAVEALNTLTSAEIAEIKSLKSPPPPIRLLMEAICLLKGVKPSRIADPNGAVRLIWDYWGASQKMLADVFFLRSLVNYDKDALTDELVSKIEVLTKQDALKPEHVMKVSKAAYNLCCWVHAVVRYHIVNQMVKPKMEALQRAEETYKTLMNSLTNKQESCREVEKSLGSIQANLKKMQQEKSQIENQAKDCAQKLSRSHELLISLDGERCRWKSLIEDYKNKEFNIIGDALLAAGFVTYLGPIGAHDRLKLVDCWTQKCHSIGLSLTEPFNFVKLFGDPIRQLIHLRRGLPNDLVSVQNTIIMEKSQRWPYFIDPQNQAKKWIKKTEQSENLVVISTNDPSFNKQLQKCIRTGCPILVENVEKKVPPSLLSVLERRTFVRDGVVWITLGQGGPSVEFSDNFRLYMTTQESNPQISDDLASALCVLNFSISNEALQDQLLSSAVSEENGVLEKEKEKVVEELTETKRQLSQLEDRVLFYLTSCRANIVDDESAISTLFSSKKLAIEIEEQQNRTRENEIKIDIARNAYSLFCQRSAKLFFILEDLRCLSSIYCFNLQFFLTQFRDAIQITNQSLLQMEEAKENAGSQVLSFEDKLNLFYQNLLVQLHGSVTPALETRHRRLFSFLLAVCATDASKSEIDLLYRCINNISSGSDIQKIADEFPESIRSTFRHLLQQQHMLDTILQSSNPFDADTVSYNDCNDVIHLWNCLTSLQKLLLCIVYTKNPIKLIDDYIKHSIGSEFIVDHYKDIEDALNESKPFSPIFLTLSEGKDPCHKIADIAKQRKIRLQLVSLGQDQEERAHQLLTTAITQGEWIMFQNCHLATRLLPLLESQFINSKSLHPNFRFWWTAYPNHSLPSSLLEISIKITLEMPITVKSTVQALWKLSPICNNEFFTACQYPIELQRIAIGLTLFHSVLIGRTQLCIGDFECSFSDSDLQVTIQQARVLLDSIQDKNELEMVITSISSLVVEVIYGARLHSIYGRDVLKAIFEEYININLLTNDSLVLRSHSEDTNENSIYVPLPRNSVCQNIPEQLGACIQGSLPLLDFDKKIVDEYNQNRWIELKCNLVNFKGRSLLTRQRMTSKVKHTVDKMIKMIDSHDWTKAIQELQLTLRERVPLSSTQHNQYFQCSFILLLLKEIESHRRTLNVVGQDLHRIKRSSAGKCLWTSEDYSILSSLENERCPLKWVSLKNRPITSRQPLFVFENYLHRRSSFLSELISRPSTNIAEIPPICLSLITSPKDLCTIIAQELARRSDICLETGALEGHIIDHEYEDNESRDQSSFIINGLHLYGGYWDQTNHMLLPRNKSDDKQTTTSYSVRIHPIYQNKGNLSSITTFHCPVAGRREHNPEPLFYVNLPTEHSSTFWTRRSTSLSFY